MKHIEFVPKAFEEYHNWILNDKKIAIRIGDLIRDILRNPFTGIGKPEALKYQYKGFWSRRIDNEHRLIYSVIENSIIIFSCYSHYS